MALVQTVREVFRQIATKVGVYQSLRRLRGQPLDHLKLRALEDRFAHIYRTRLWALADPQIPTSGSGSTMEATKTLRGELPNLLNKIGTRTLLDVGCGDFNWMRTVPLEGIDYVGVDIVADLIEENEEEYGAPHVRFVQGNAISDSLPAADTVLIREVLFHLSFADGIALLRNLLSKPRSYVLMTTDRVNAVNVDIRSGDWRLLNLEAAPFKFRKPELFISENEKVPHRRLAAWKADDIREWVECTEFGARRP